MAGELFTPFGTATTGVSASTTTASGALSVPTGQVNYSVRVYNACSVAAFIKFGNSAVTATATDMPIPPGGVETFQMGPAVTYAAAILGSSTGTVYFTTGCGA